MKSELDKLIDQINSALTPERVLEIIGYRAEGIQAKGESMRCYCPIHKDTLLRSLTIDVSKRMFKCMYTGCEGKSGGRYFDLYRMAKKTGPEESALALAGILKINAAGFVAASAPVVLDDKKVLDIEVEAEEEIEVEPVPEIEIAAESPVGEVVGEELSDFLMEPSDTVDDILTEEIPQESTSQESESPEPDEKPRTQSKAKERSSKRISFI